MKKYLFCMIASCLLLSQTTLAATLSVPPELLLSKPVVAAASSVKAMPTTLAASQPIPTQPQSTTVKTPVDKPVTKTTQTTTSTPAPSPAVTAIAAPVITAPKIQHRGSPNNALYEQLDELRSQNAILTEKLKNIELQNKINESGGGSSTKPLLGTSTSSMMGQVQTVSGANNNFKALIKLENGTSLTIRTGSVVPGLGIVKSITLNEVIISNKSQIISLPFIGDTTHSNIPGMPGMPGMPGGIN